MEPLGHYPHPEFPLDTWLIPEEDRNDIHHLIDESKMGPTDKSVELLEKHFTEDEIFNILWHCTNQSYLYKPYAVKPSGVNAIQRVSKKWLNLVNNFNEA